MRRQDRRIIGACAHRSRGPTFAPLQSVSRCRPIDGARPEPRPTPSRFSCSPSMIFMATSNHRRDRTAQLDRVDAGGAEYFATHLATLAARNPNTLIVSAGDLIGASPLLSGMFHDEPTIEALNAMGVDVASVGNHEFDNGWRELLRMQNGGCHLLTDVTPFAGASSSTRLPTATVGRRPCCRRMWSKRWAAFASASSADAQGNASAGAGRWRRGAPIRV